MSSNPKDVPGKSTTPPPSTAQHRPIDPKGLHSHSPDLKAHPVGHKPGTSPHTPLGEHKGPVGHPPPPSTTIQPQIHPIHAHQPGILTHPHQPGAPTHPHQPGAPTHPHQPGAPTHPHQPGAPTHPQPHGIAPRPKPGGHAVVSDTTGETKEEKKPIIATKQSDSSPESSKVSSSASDTPQEWGKERVYMKCPNCGKNIYTEIIPVVGKKTWIVFGILCALGLWLCCSLLPFCTMSCQDLQHRCPECGEELGIYKRWK